MDWITKLKAGFIALFTIINAGLGLLAIPVYSLISLNVIDYITGLMAARKRGEKISSYRGFEGIAKKICMWLLVGVGWIIDLIIENTLMQVGIVLPIGNTIAICVAVWLAFNEIISLLENVQDIGVELPPFLMQIATKIKKTVAEKIDSDAEENKNEGN